MDILRRMQNVLNRVLVILGGVAVLSLMVIATGNVCLRIFQVPYRGAYELVCFFGAVVIASSLSETQMRKSHIVVDILSETFPDGLKKIVDVISYLIAAVFFAIISWVIFRWGLKIASSGELSETLKIIYYPFIFCVALGFSIFCLTLVVDFFSRLFEKRGNPAS